MKRMELIPKIFAKEFTQKYNPDFLIVQESMVAKQHNVLRKGMISIGYPYETKQLAGSLVNLKLTHGGLVVFSRHKIIAQDCHIFDGTCSSDDCLAAKGCVYAKIRKHGNNFHVFGVHLQAWESAESRAVRRGQIYQMGKFVDRQNIPSDEPVIMMGDFNINMYSEPDQLKLMYDFDMVKIHDNSYPFTVDPSTNKLVGLDDGNAYKSAKFEQGCYNHYLKTMRCVCCPQEWLDYAFVHKQYKTCDLQTSWMKSVVAKADPFYTNITATVRRKVEDLSDHYPLLCVLDYPDIVGVAEEKSDTFEVDHIKSPDAPHDIYSTVKIVCIIIFTVVIILAMLRIFRTTKK